MKLVRALFSRRWWWVTLLVIGVMLLLARLGVWQLDRLDERRAENVQKAAVLASEVLDLNTATSTLLSADMLPPDLASLENRKVSASGEFDFENQIILKVQNWQGRAGVHLITPLVLDGGETSELSDTDVAVLIDRGWIPDADNTAEALRKYDVPNPQNIDGFVAMSQTLSGGRGTIPEDAEAEWYRVDIEAIEPQMPYSLLPIYLLQAAEGNDALPYREDPEIDLSEGNHLSYAMQWFIFSIGLGIGYLAFVYTQEKKSHAED